MGHPTHARTVATFASLIQAPLLKAAQEARHFPQDGAPPQSGGPGELSLERLIAKLPLIEHWTRLRPNPVRVDLGHLLKDAVARRYPEALPYLSVDRTSLCRVDADPQCMAFVLECLVQNARQFKREGALPLLFLRRALEEGDGVFVLGDNGTGFSTDKVKEVFTLGGTAHGPTKSGAGVGLFLCRYLMERSQGKIWADPKEGQGTRIYLQFPS